MASLSAPKGPLLGPSKLPSNQTHTISVQLNCTEEETELIYTKVYMDDIFTTLLNIPI